MWKFLIFVVCFLSVASGEIPNNSSASTQKLNSQIPLNSTQQAKQPAAISTNVVISEKNDHDSNEEGKIIGKGEAKLINSHQSKEPTIEDVDDTENFKYYWVLLVFSSLSIIGLIVFKSFRYLSMIR